MKSKTIPSFIYGTAWKEEATAACVKKAVAAGFRAIDTANQKKHYREDYVGEALAGGVGVERDQLWLQSKYTYQRGQDHRLPYDPSASFKEQVRASFDSTLRNLHTDYLDSFLLHGPSSPYELGAADWQVWETMEEILASGRVHFIGVSNISFAQLKELVAEAGVKPAFVQNRCYSEMGWDREVREFCLENKIVYQGFSLLTANRQLLNHPAMLEIAGRLRATVSQVIFAFARSVGMLPLTGTTSDQHMREDLASLDMKLTSEEISLIHTLGE